MSTLFGQMVSREITAIKTKMPITKDYEKHEKYLKQLQSPVKNDYSLNVTKSSEEITIGDIRTIFRSK